MAGSIQEPPPPDTSPDPGSDGVVKEKNAALLVKGTKKVLICGFIVKENEQDAVRVFLDEKMAEIGEFEEIIIDWLPDFFIMEENIGFKVRLGSVPGPVIQATGRSEFEDGLGSGDSYHMSVRTGLPDHSFLLYRLGFTTFTNNFRHIF
jgi:hypothetical protein